MSEPARNAASSGPGSRSANRPGAARVLLATTNAGKLRELRPVLAAMGLDLCGLEAFPGLAVAPEDADSFAGNALAKARFYAQATGLPVLADDSGLVVTALSGAPGVHSARYAGPQADDAANRARLLAELGPHADRSAIFVCALCLLDPAAPGATLAVEGRCSGKIAQVERGSQGFGYDPLFVPDDARAAGRSFAQLSPAEKLALSHRGRALAALAEALAARAAGDSP